MARLDHPNIVQFCDADQHGETCFFAMEYVDGIDLGKYVRLSGPAPIREACDFVRQAALGLQHAHERNLVHRDIKPVNLLLTQTPAVQVHAVAARPGALPEQALTRHVVKILDWGLAGSRAPRGAGPQPLETISKGLVGTVDYLSPEQARNAGTVDIRGDIYSLGCTLYFRLTGQPPFPDGTLMQKVLKHQQAEPAALDSFRNDVPAGVTAILKRMVAKRPEDRFQTPAALALALTAFTRGDGVPRAAGMLPSTKGTPALKQRDDTPLPIRLGGQANQPVPRQPRIDTRRNTDKSSDTACA